MTNTVEAADKKSLLKLDFSRQGLWSVGSSSIALFIAAPILTIASFLFAPATDIWQHLVSTVLADYVIHSLILMLCVGTCSVVIGVSTAWLTTLCDFPGRKILQWALLLPLSAPAYIIAFTYAGMLDPVGPLQTLLRSSFNWQYGEYWFPEIRSLGGAIFILTLVLYPYVYLLTRAAFLEQSVCVLEVSRTLGCGPWRSFRRVALPLARPAIVAGLILVSMETLADYGTVHFFGVPTFTTGIFRTWFGLGDISAAAQLAMLLMSFIAILIIFERLTRKQARYHHTSNRYSELPRYRLRGWASISALLACLLPLSLGFILPGLQLAWWSFHASTTLSDSHFYLLLWNSVWLAAVAAVVILATALFLAYAQRMRPKPSVNIPVRISSMGYAVPGTVIAVGVVILSGWFDQTYSELLQLCCAYNPGLILSGGFIALIFAYLVRFLSVSLQTLEAGLNKIKPSMDEAARAYGRSPLQVIRQIHMPIMRGTILTAVLLVFIDVLKELPATLVMRPFNFNTLAVRAYELAGDERLIEASTTGLAIVLAGLIPVIMLSKAIGHSRPGSRKK